MGIYFKGCRGHIFTEYSAEELQILGLTCEQKRLSDVGVIRDRFNFLDPNGESVFLEFDDIYDDEKFKKNQGSIDPDIFIEVSEGYEVPESIKFQNVHIKVRTQNDNLSSSAHWPRLVGIITSFKSEQVEALGLDKHSENLYFFKNKIALYNIPRLETFVDSADLLRRRKSSGFLGVIVQGFDLKEQPFPRFSNFVVNGFELKQLKEASKNFDIFFAGSDFRL